MLWSHRLPLQAKLPIFIALILSTAMAISSLAAWALLRVSMLGELDSDLLAAAKPLANRQLLHVGLGGDSDLTGLLPSDYFLAQQDLAGKEVFRYLSQDADPASAPALPTFDVALINSAGTPITVPSSDGMTAWRVVLGVNLVSNQVVGITWVGLPMSQVDTTLGNLAQILIAVSAVVVILGAGAGHLVVSRSLRGLKEMELAANAVTAGDLSARAPQAPLSTEVGKVAASFNSMVATVAEAFRLQEENEQRMRRFISDASHELRTPLASLRGFGELYRMGAVPADDVPKTFARIESEAIRMGEMVADLLTLARLDEGPDLTLAPVDLAILVDDAATTLRSLDPARNVQIHAVAPIIIQGDQHQLSQLLTNLVGNVVAHTPAATPVEITVHTYLAEGMAGQVATNRAQIRIIDHGPGVPQAQREAIFDRFYRADPSRARSGGGTGLGLAIAASIVAAHSGRIWVEETPGGGATMVCDLPQAAEPPQQAPGVQS